MRRKGRGVRCAERQALWCVREREGGAGPSGLEPNASTAWSCPQRLGLGEGGGMQWL